MSGVSITLQKATQIRMIPARKQFLSWIAATVNGRRDSAEVTIRIVDEAEGRILNRSWRKKDYPTNVLSFAADLPPGIHSSLLGDLVICAPVVLREAVEQHKTPEAHWAHLVIHGTLHLLGHDHETASEAREMEGLEISLLAGLGYPDPYRN